MSQQKRQLVVKGSSKLALAFGPAPVLDSEDPEAYVALEKSIFEAVGPSGIIEEMWARQYAELTWEIRRYAALKVFAIKAARAKALEETLAPLVDGPWRFGAIDVYDERRALKSRPSMEYANDFVQCNAERIEEIDDILREANLTMEDVEHRAMLLAMDKLAQINDLMAKLQNRANALLRDISGHRKAFADNLRRVQSMDGECTEIENQSLVP